MSVRVRYAPSPTGFQHIGGVRSALFNYFFARSRGGTFILRIEDTDQGRYSEEGLADLYETFRWLGIRWDEGPDIGGPFGPYVQSERTELYRKHAQYLLETGQAYECFCSQERLASLRTSQHEEHGASGYGYDRHCRELSAEERKRLRGQGVRPVIRFRIPLEGSTVFHDLLLGDVERKNTDINPDPVLLKSDGFPTYHLANVVDDHLMEISHIMRAQEWLPSGNLHVLLYRAFGWDPPAYCHLPMVMGTDGQKLSKRHGATAVREFRAMGCLPEALINYVSLVGWHYDETTELFSVDDFERLFSLEKLSKSPGVFDYRKLEWYNGVYIRQKSDEELASLVFPYLVAAGFVSDPPAEGERKTVVSMMGILKERMKYLNEVVDLSRFLFREIAEYPVADAIPKKMDARGAVRMLQADRALAEKLFSQTDEEAEEAFRSTAAEMGVKLGDLMTPLRIAVTGSRISPPLVGSLRLLGKEKALARIDRLLKLLEEFSI